MHRRISKFTSYCYQFGPNKVLVLSLVQIRSKSKIWRKVGWKFFVKHYINVGKWMKDLAIIRTVFIFILITSIQVSHNKSHQGYGAGKLFSTVYCYSNFCNSATFWACNHAVSSITLRKKEKNALLLLWWVELRITLYIYSVILPVSWL